MSTPSPYCRVIVEVCDEMRCLISESMSVEHTVVESSIKVLTFGAESVGVALNDEQLQIERFERRDLICGAPECTINPRNISTHSTAVDLNANQGYVKQRFLKFTPVNATKIELMRFTTNVEDQKIPR